MEAKPFDHDNILAQLDEMLELAHDRALAVEDDELRIKWLRSFGYLVDRYRKLAKEQELEEMEAQIEVLSDLAGGEFE